jgi:hypothetical protein
VTCTRASGQATDVVDARTGAVMTRLPTAMPVRSDGVVVSAADGTRFDATSFAPLPRSWVPPIEPPVTGRPPDPRPIVVDGGAWRWRTASIEPATGYRSETLTSVGVANGALELVDDQGDVVERWPGTSTYWVNRGGNMVSSPVVAADAQGAWLAAGGRIHRLHRST